MEEEFDKKSTKKRFTVLGLALLALLGVPTVALEILPYVFPGYLELLKGLGTNFIMGLNYVLLYGIGFLLFALIVRNVPKDELPKQNMTFGQLFIIMAMAYPFIISGNLTGTLMEYMICPENATINTIMDFFFSDSVIPEIVAVLVAPVVEELIFRKMLIDRTKRYGEKTAILFSALCFGLYHRTIPQFFYATAIGCFFGYVYSRTGKIHYTMILHACINGFSTVMVLLTKKVMEISNRGTFGDNSAAETILGSLMSLTIVMMELFMFGYLIVGIIFLCKKLRKVRFSAAGPCCIPKGQRFSTVWLNWGMILFAVICIAMTFVSLLSAEGAAAPTEFQYPGEWV